MRKRRGVALIFSLLLVFLGTALGLVRAEDRRTVPCRLSVMTLNAEFLWDGVAPEEGQADFPWKHSQTEAEDHMRKVAEVIIRSNPDVINLVEVENLNALTVFNTKFLAGRGYLPYFIQGTDTFTGQDVVLLTRIDPENNVIQRDDRKGRAGTVMKAVSKNYYAKVVVDNTSMSVIGLHFLAFPLHQGRRLEREAQADAIRTLGRELRGQGHFLVILGDFNDYDGDPASRDHIDSMPITNVLSSIRGMDPADASDDLTNAAQFVPKAQRYTAFHDANQNDLVDPPRELTSIDHVLLSPELAAKVELVEMPHQHDPREVTDHFPVVVRLKLCDGPTGPPSAGFVRITSLLPNPPGDDTQNEEASLKNLGGQAVSLVGWKFRDLAGRIWSLDMVGTLQPGEERVIHRQGQPMALNNSGDTIELVDAGGTVVQSITYSAVVEGEVVTPGN